MHPSNHGPALPILHGAGSTLGAANICPSSFSCATFVTRKNFLVTQVAEELPYINVKLPMFTDYTIKTQRQHRSFYAFKAAMRVKSIWYSIVFPAKLRVVDGETVKFFTNPKDTAAWLEALLYLPSDVDTREIYIFCILSLVCLLLSRAVFLPCLFQFG